MTEGTEDRGLYMARGVDANIESEWTEREVQPHWRTVGERNDEIVYVTSEGKLSWPGSPDYVQPEDEGRMALVSGAAEVVYVEGGAANPSVEQQRQVEEQNEAAQQETATGGDTIQSAEGEYEEEEEDE